MNKKIVILVGSILCFYFSSEAQSLTSLDSLKREIIQLNDHVQDINLRMESSKSRFQSGIIVSTIGYTTVITGGLMLGRENDQLGQGLLVAGGVTGIVGTYLLTDAFRVLAGKKKKKRPR